jgi:hypothetical protein
MSEVPVTSSLVYRVPSICFYHRLCLVGADLYRHPSVDGKITRAKIRVNNFLEKEKKTHRMSGGQDLEK